MVPRSLKGSGETVEFAQRDGWLFVHGDRASCVSIDSNGTIIGHLHPVRAQRWCLGAGVSCECEADRRAGVDALLGAPGRVSDGCFEALQLFGVTSRRDLQVIAATANLVYPLGSLSALRQELVRPAPPTRRYHRNFLRSDR